MIKTSPYNMLKYAFGDAGDAAKRYMLSQDILDPHSRPNLSEILRTAGAVGVIGGGAGSITEGLGGSSPLHGLATGGGAGAGAVLGSHGGDELGRLAAPHLARLVSRLGGGANSHKFVADAARDVGTAVGGMGGSVLGGVAGHYLTKPKEEEKKASMTPMVAAFVERCEQLGLNSAKQASLACRMFPVLTDEFCKAGFNPLDAADQAMNGTTIGAASQAIPYVGTAAGAVGAANSLSKGVTGEKTPMQAIGGAIPHAANAAIGAIPGGGMVRTGAKILGGVAASALGNAMGG
jgi:hypothetical protein